MIRVLIANGNILARIGLRTLLSKAEDIELVGEAINGYEAMRQYKELRPDIILWDLKMPGPQTIEFLSSLQEEQSRSKLIIVTPYKEKHCVRDLINAGVTGYVLTEETEQAIIYAIYTVMHGGTWLSRDIVDILVNTSNIASEQNEDLFLTDRELQLLELISRGWGNTRLAKHLCLSEQTVRNYIKNLYTKLEVHSRAEAVVWARDHGIGGVWCG